MSELLRNAVERLRPASTDPTLDAQVLLAHVLGRDRGWLYAWPEYVPDEATCRRFQHLVAERCAGRPVAHLVGAREFWSLPLRVDQHTLIPRPETERLVEVALDLDLPDDARVLDLGTGSGAIALALASERPRWEIVAVDASTQALAIARANAARLQLTSVEFVGGNWFAPLAGRARFDLVVSNPPYIADTDPHLQQGDVRFEPRSALASGADGLDAIRTIIADAGDHLSAGGWLWLEHGFEQAGAVIDLLQAAGFGDAATHHDLAGHARLSGGRWQP
ncbi:MAG: peptide chain release factor N(5)-glutamine methyltransferase [Gammaproteobacteria bacterium]|nr:peptide chain release factor N(5)-glutamine methyltransferase [Gammaproteobacteria bacterium]